MTIPSAGEPGAAGQPASTVPASTVPASTAPASTAPASTVPGPANWQLDPSASTVSLTHKTYWGLATVHGAFGKVSGSGETLADGTGRGRLELDASSLDTKNAERDNHLRSADFFNANQHPQITVDIAKAARQGADTVLADGPLTVAGQSRPLSVTARVTEASDQAVTLTTTTEIDRGDFGIKWNRLGMIKGPARATIVARFVKAAQ